MLILTEKPSVARDFARALGCSFNSSEQIYKNSDGNLVITNCVGHLFNLQQPDFYDPEFKHWYKLPVIPEEFAYSVNPQTKDVAKRVISQIKKHAKDSILIATDADREGEIIARECLNAANVFDYSNISRFWVSQALTPEVIQEGIRKAKPLADYNELSEKGFSRQKADWLIGINFTRFLTNCSGTLLPVGRVQTAILSAIGERCSKIENFQSEKYYEFEGRFGVPRGTPGSIYLSGLYIDSDGNSSFPTDSKAFDLHSLHNQKAFVISDQNEIKSIYPPQLYNLNELQKDAFKYYGYSAEKTLQLVQKLYEEYKCVSYPRTPSTVMGQANIELCQDVFSRLSQKYIEYIKLTNTADFSMKNKRVFDDSKLEAHHAIIPLNILPPNTTEEESNIYFLILERFFLAFAPVHKYNKRTVILKVGDNQFKIEGRTIVEEGWKLFELIRKQFGQDEEKEQDLSKIDWENLYLDEVKTLEKYTKAPKYFNEASILSFMENPKSIETEEKLIGLGTPATRHTFIPKLQKSGYITVEKKNIKITELGKVFLQAVNQTSVKPIAQISQTTRWEEQLELNPNEFLVNTKRFVAASVIEKTDLRGVFSQFSSKTPSKTSFKRGRK